MDDDRDGVPLGQYLGDQLMGVRFECLACCWHAGDFRTEDVVAKLKARGLGDERTGVRALARLSRTPCARCGALRWECRPVYRPLLRD